ncbi:MAG: hypothetical protein AABP62_13090 [Planctomycetota bacterium]
MRKFVACALLGMAVMANASNGAERQPVRLISLLQKSPTLLTQVDLPMPAPLSQVPEVQYSGPVTGMPVMPATVELYQNVRYRAERNIAPCAVPIIVQVPDPCACKTACCPTPCVNVQICVPECGCPCVKVTRCGDRVCFDYGKYEVIVTSGRGRVCVDYRD